jgi:hypothetical protein
MVKKIPLMPHLENPEVNARVHGALQLRDEADYKCYQLLESLLSRLPLKASEIKCLEADQIFLDSCHQAVKERQDANEAFVRALSGR